MRIIKMYALLGFILITPNYTAAGWEVASPGPAGPITPREPFFQSKIQSSSHMGAFRPAPPINGVLNNHVNGVLNNHAGPLPLGAHPMMPPNTMPNGSTLGQPRGLYAISICGSLKENIERIMSRYHWKVVWKAPYDYNFDGRIIGKSLPNVIDQLLKPFPLHAVMYMSNRTLAVTSRPRYK